MAILFHAFGNNEIIWTLELFIVTQYNPVLYPYMIKNGKLAPMYLKEFQRNAILKIIQLGTSKEHSEFNRPKLL